MNRDDRGDCRRPVRPVCGSAIAGQPFVLRRNNA